MAEMTIFCHICGNHTAGVVLLRDWNLGEETWQRSDKESQESQEAASGRQTMFVTADERGKVATVSKTPLCLVFAPTHFCLKDTRWHNLTK